MPSNFRMKKVRLRVIIIRAFAYFFVELIEWLEWTIIVEVRSSYYKESRKKRMRAEVVI